MRSFSSVGDVIENVLTGLEMGSRTREYLALILWPDIVGEQVARITAVESVRNGVLHVDVDSAVWAQELQYYKPDMLTKVNNYVGGGAIHDILFHVRTRPRKGAARGRSPARPKRGQPVDIQLTLDECREIEETAHQVSDPELREALTGTMASYRRMERWMVIEGWKRCVRCQALYRRRRG